MPASETCISSGHQNAMDMAICQPVSRLLLLSFGSWLQRVAAWASEALVFQLVQPGQGGLVAVFLEQLADLVDKA